MTPRDLLPLFKV